MIDKNDFDFSFFFKELKNNEQELLSFRDLSTIHKIKKSDFFYFVLNVSAQLSHLPKKKLVLLSFEHSLDLFVSFFACLASDLIPAIIAHPSSKVSSQDFFHKIEALSNQHKPSLILASKTTSNIISNKIDIPISTPDIYLTSKTNINFPKNPEFAQFSSGSTGLPKAIKYNFKQLTLHFKDFEQTLNLNSKSKFISWLPLYHDMGLIACFLFPIIKSYSLHLIDPFYWIQNPFILFEDIENFNSTHTWMPNFAYKHLSKNKSNTKYNLSSIKSFSSCAEPVDPDTLIEFYNRFSKYHLQANSFAITYAMAENIFAMTHHQIDIKKDDWYLKINQKDFRNNKIRIDSNSSKKIASCGIALQNTKVQCKSSYPNYSEVFIQSNYMIDNYWNSNKQSILTEHFFNTQDLGFIYNNQLYICGRSSDLIISRGINLFPQEIEDFVSKQNNIYSGRVVCIGDFDNKISTEKIILLFEVQNSYDNDYQKLENQITSKVYSKLGIIIDEIKAFPYKSLMKTSSGKVARLPNLELYKKQKIKNIHVLGCSHIYSFNQSNELYNQDTCAKNIFLKQIPVVSAENINKQPRKQEIENYIQSLHKSSIALFYFGEQDIRTYIPFLIRQYQLSLSNAIEHIMTIYSAFLNHLNKLRPDLQFAWIVPPPPGVGLEPHPKFVNTQQLDNECYYHFLDTQLHRKNYAQYYKKALTSLKVPVIDIWPDILDNQKNISIKTKYIGDYSHLKNVKPLLEKEIIKQLQVQILSTKIKPKQSKVILVIENVEAEMKALILDLFNHQVLLETNILSLLNSLHIVELIQSITTKYEVSIPNNWMEKSEIESFKKLCSFVLKYRKKEQ
ncbi:MAG: hypothetical protein COB02_00185 [Candidatus Cloacimonadota bacterium]|nr:MAG: hypothetical protein COB02_04320 [Candidatus Cloacimonadota bacterium]PCJ21041.1 MAG: hypothetical protein COB02_00185 [Candidatus Cloacimonadota bacterium]